LKGLDAAAKFTKTNILTCCAGCEKWQQAQAKVLGNTPANVTNARFNRVMLTFIQKCGATSETAEDLCISIMNAKKTSNLHLETLTVVKVEVTIITQEADPVTITTKGEETKTETETTTDKININKTTETKITATPNIDTTPATKGDAEKMRHTGLTLTMKAMTDKTLTFQRKAMTTPLIMNFTLPMKSFMTPTRIMTRKKMTNLPKIQMTQA
jgi:hypothetical protein